MKTNKLMLVTYLFTLLFLCCSCGSPEGTYNQAQSFLSKGKYTEAAEKFESIGSYEDAATLVIYCKACALCEAGNFESGIAALETLGDYKDCKMRIVYYNARFWESSSMGTTEYETMEYALSIYNENPLYLDSAQRILALEERITAAKKKLYDEAINSAEDGNYDTSFEVFLRLGDYEDSAQRYKYYNAKRFEHLYSEQGIAAFLLQSYKWYSDLDNYLDSQERVAALKETLYQEAKNLYNEGDYGMSYFLFKQLRGYKDVDELLLTNENLKAERNKEFSVGNTISFGNYPQTSSGSDNTPIEWIILSREGNSVLLLSQYGLDCQPFHNYRTDVVWENSFVRSWLNDEFLNRAFTKEEQNAIKTTIVQADNCVKEYWRNSHLDPGQDTQDKVFLLSITEAEQFLVSPSTRLCFATDYAHSQGAKSAWSDQCSWWLRSTGHYQGECASVQSDEGNIASIWVDIDNRAVRPALWVSLDSGAL